MKAIGIIPARYGSSRFPGKPLINILGIPLVIRVANIVSGALGKENTYIATDDERIRSTVVSNGFECVMTSGGHRTGTDRLAEVSHKISADIYLNIQGDEPMIDPKDILKIKNAKIENPEFIINGMAPIGSNEDPKNVNIPKVIVNKNNEMIYMSRNLLPGKKDIKKGNPLYYKQVCIYAFNFSELKNFASSPSSKCEYFEDIEILRFTDSHHKVKMVEVSGGSLAVDVPDDVKKVEKALQLLSK